MSGLEVNKILAAIIMAVLIVFLISNIGDYLVNPNKDSNTKTAYNVESTESTTTEENKEITPIHTGLANDLVYDELATRRREGNGKRN